MAGQAREQFLSALPTTEDILLGVEGPDGKPASVFDGCVVTSIHSNQRPLRGVAGALDWRLRGFLSRFVRAGRIRGEKNEFVYIPILHRDSNRHLLLVGLGPDTDARVATGLLKGLQGRIAGLGFRKAVVSLSSFPGISESDFREGLGGIELEFTR